MAKIREVKADNGEQYTLAFTDDNHNPIDESKATNVYITEMDKYGKIISTRFGKVNQKSNKMNNKPTTNAEQLVENALSYHNRDPWYMSLLEAALDRDDIPTVNEAIELANKAYEENPYSPTIVDAVINEEDEGDDEDEDMTDNVDIDLGEEDNDSSDDEDEATENEFDEGFDDSFEDYMNGLE